MTRPGPNITVAIVGDATLRGEVEASIDQRDTLIVVGSVDRDQGVATAVGRVPDVVIIIESPGGVADAADMARQIGAALPATRILAVHRGGAGAAGSDPGVEGLIDGWVAGRVELDGGTALADAVEWVFMGEAVLDQGLAAGVLTRHQQGASPLVMTPTEEEVLTRLAAGDTIASLADDYAVTPRLVRQHAGGALARLHPPA